MSYKDTESYKQMVKNNNLMLRMDKERNKRIISTGKGWHGDSEGHRLAQYKVTGKYYNSSKNFKAIKTDNWSYANGINLWRGKVYKLQPNGKYKTIKEVWN